MTGPRWLPAVATVLAVLLLASGFRSAPTFGDFRIGDFGELPVVDRGRVKPLDTLARTTLLVISTKQTFRTDGQRGTTDPKRAEGMEKAPAIRWLLDVATRPAIARDYEIVRIDHPDLLGLLGLDRDRKYFSVSELLEHGAELDRQIGVAMSVPDRSRTPFQRKILRLSQQLNAYFYIENAGELILIPPAEEGEHQEGWRKLSEGRHEAAEHGEAEPSVAFLSNALAAWEGERADVFNAAVTGYLGDLENRMPDRMGKVKLESTFHRVAPFVRSSGLYVLALILGALSWLGWSRNLSRAALIVLVLGLVVHSAGIVARIVIQGRPPVTNLYSSAIFVGWGAVGLGAILERIYKNGVGVVTGGLTGFVTLLVAHHLSLDGDTMTMMQAVLDTNFWLATHVVVITLGYASTFLAGLLGIVFILRGVFTKGLSGEDARNLSRMIYGIVCFATLFSFVGTILGGIWADQSWGRFWGWDPKENGALLIVLWNALILHAKWGGLARERGLAALAVFGNIVTSWSWFGTNMLGVGLHAYGFIDSALFWMFVFVVSQLALIAIAMIPPHRWRSPEAVRSSVKKTAPA